MFAFIVIAQGQDPHAPGVESMKIWYNPSLKTDKDPLVSVNYRKANYPGIITYDSKSLTVELPFLPADVSNSDNLKYVTLSVGLNTDNGGNGFLKASTAMLGLAYAMPLGYNNTYIAIGLQANYSFNRVGNDGSLTFSENFDKAGALGWSVRMDPFQSGYNYSYFTVSAGTSFFHSGEKSEWFAGGSARYFNHPYTEWGHADRLATAYGLQGGYTFFINPVLQASAFGNFSWQNDTEKTLQQYIGITGTRHFDMGDSSNVSVLFGLGMRPSDAIIPTAGFRYRRNLITVYYELNFPGSRSKNYYRRAFDISYKLNFW